MKHKVWITASLLLGLVAGCGSRSTHLGDEHVTLEPVYGSTTVGVGLVQTGKEVTLTFTSLPTKGRMLRLNLPDGLSAVHQVWSGDTGTIHLVAPINGGAEIGIVPTAGYTGDRVMFECELRPSSRIASLAPIGPANIITDLTIASPTFGFAELAWTQMNVGDYDFNGEVNIADLTPLAPRLGLAVNRAAADANLQTNYWVDGDANGQINISDITPIGGHYKSSVHGYLVKQNGNALPGDTAGAPTVLAASAEHRIGLPNRYQVTKSGLTSDSWVVTPVDVEGNEGADSAGNPGSAPVDLNTTLDVIGLDLRDLDSGEAGEFGPGKFSTRVIDPGDVVYRAQLGTSTYSGTTTQVSNLPRNTVLIVNYRIAPTVNLATGAPKGGSSLKGTSAVAEDDIVNIAVIFKLPAGTNPAQIDTVAEALPNPDGGYFLDLTANLDIPGDNPDTFAVEPSFSQTQLTRLNFANGTVSRDTNGNGWEDNAHVGDPDHDGVGENERERFHELEDDDRDEADETEIKATVQSIDLLAGTITLTGIADDGGALSYTGAATAAFDFTELSEFIERNDQFEDEFLINPALLNPGDEVEVDMYPALNGGYWIEKVKRDLRT